MTEACFLNNVLNRQDAKNAKIGNSCKSALLGGFGALAVKIRSS
jgi:hypothetical protein